MFQLRVKERQLQAYLKYLCQLEYANPGAGIADICYIKSQLNEICEDCFRGVLVQTRAEKYIFGERISMRKEVRIIEGD